MPKHSSHWNVKIPVFRAFTVMAMMACGRQELIGDLCAGRNFHGCACMPEKSETGHGRERERERQREIEREAVQNRADRHGTAPTIFPSSTRLVFVEALMLLR